jgi:hypothetical protein
MVLKSYFDCSGKPHDPGCKKVTLGGYVATDDQWAIFEAAWEKALKNHPCPVSSRGNPYFHAKEVFHKQGGYKGWDDDMARALVSDLRQVLFEQGRGNLIGFSCTVDKADYAQAKIGIPALRRIESICLDHCIGNSLRHPEIDLGMEIVFDRDEDFRDILSASWKETVAGERTWWAKDVLSIGEVDDMRFSYALQGADFLAWSANRYHTHGPDDAYGRNFSLLHLLNLQCHAYYDQDEFSASFNPDGSLCEGRARTPKVRFPTGTRIGFRIPEGEN